MSNTTAVVTRCVAVAESLIIFVANIFTIFVFWKHRNKLKRTSFLLINLAVVDLLVGFIGTVVYGSLSTMPQYVHRVNHTSNQNILAGFQTTFSFASVFFLVLISLERAYALIWPLRHRVASTKGYIYSVIFAWVAAISVGASTLLAMYDILDGLFWVIALGSINVLALITICGSYLAIRTRLSSNVPSINTAHNRPNAQEQNTKLSRTLFIVIAASLVCWLPNIVVYCIHFLFSIWVPLPLLDIFDIFHLTNSLINPIIYSFRIPMFRETLKRMKIRKQSKRYKVNYRP